jgi:endonuclease YncB( thermonuclease family)
MSIRQQVKCIPVGEGTPCDRHSKAYSRDRIVAQCFLGGQDIAAEIVRAGHACDWPKFSAGHYRVSAQTCVR